MTQPKKPTVDTKTWAEIGSMFSEGAEDELEISNEPAEEVHDEHAVPVEQEPEHHLLDFDGPGVFGRDV